MSSILVFANAVLYGFHGLLGSVAVDLLVVELAGPGLRWMYLPFGVMLACGLCRTACAGTMPSRGTVECSPACRGRG